MKIFFIFLLIFCFFSCKKEDLVNNLEIPDLNWQKAGVCTAIFPVQPIEAPIELGTQYKSPVFNPSNEEEFIYYKEIADEGSSIKTNYQIIKYNLRFNTEKVILEGVKIIGNLAYNKSRWIAFKNAEDHHIYIMQDDGSLLIQFSNEVEDEDTDESLVWLKGANNLFWGGNTDAGEPYFRRRAVTASKVSKVYKKSTGLIEDFSVNNKDVLFSENSDGSYAYAELKGDSLEWKDWAPSVSGQRLGRTNWHPKSKLFYTSFFEESYDSSNTGLFEIKYPSGEAKKIIPFCDKEWIKQVSCSKSGDYLLLWKLERDFDSEGMGTLSQNSSIWLLNLKTMEERRVGN